MHSLKKGLFAGLLIPMALIATGCSEEAAEPEVNASGGGGGEEELTIGFSGPLSGPAASYGEETLKGLELAVEDINSAGGFEVDGTTYTINLETLDDKYLPNETAANAKRLVQEEDANVIYTPHSGGVYALQVFNTQEDFILMGYTSEPGVTEQGNPLTVRIPPRYDQYLQPFTEYEMERFGERIAFLPTASQYGKDWAEALQPVWEENGGEVVFNESIDFSKDTDFQTIVANALEEDPDVMFIGGPSEPTALVAKQARDLGFEGGFLIMDQAKLDEMAAVLGDDYSMLEGAISTTPLIHTEFPGTAEYIEQYKAAGNERNPSAESAFHYVSLYVLTEAMQAAGTVEDTEAIMAAMDEGAQNVPEDKQVYVIPGVGEDGGFGSMLRMAYIEDGELQVMDGE